WLLSGRVRGGADCLSTFSHTCNCNWPQSRVREARVKHAPPAPRTPDRLRQDRNSEGHTARGGRPANRPRTARVSAPGEKGLCTRLAAAAQLEAASSP